MNMEAKNSVLSKKYVFVFRPAGAESHKSGQQHVQKIPHTWSRKFIHQIYSQSQSL